MQTASVAAIEELEAELERERELRRRLEAQLRNLADHDPLTDLLNRRSIEEELEAHAARCGRYGSEGALLLVALDGLDAVARGLGQQDADEALAVVAERVVDRLRATDVVGRIAPDELAVLLPRAGLADAEVVAEALVRVVGVTGTPRVPPGTLVASIGVAPVVVTPVGADQAEVTVGQARQALAHARRRGGRWATVDG